jgi:hypothetical protein
MVPDHAPDDLDWVTAQASCNATTMFARLLTGVREDVNRRNATIRGDGWTFEFHEDDSGFEVTRLSSSGRPPKVSAAVTFERAGRRIHVRGEDVDVDFTAVVTLDVTGACRFVVGEAVYTPWEIRRMALELLFFEEGAEEA